MARKFEIKAVLGAVDKATAPIRRVSAAISRALVKSLKSATRAAGRLTLSLGKTIGKMGLLAGAGVAGLAALGARAAHSFAMAGDELGKFSRQVGISVESLQELKFAAGQQGVSAETFDASLKMMNRGLGQLRAGTGRLYSLLDKAGLKAFKEQLAGAKSNEEAFLLLMGAIEKIEDPAKKAALATAAFGGSGAEMTRIAEAGADGLAKLRKQARDFGLVTTEQATASEAYANAVGELKAALGGLFARVAGKVIPALQKATQGISDWIQANGKFISQSLDKVFNVISNVMAAIPWDQVIGGTKQVIDAIRPLVTTIVEAVQRNWGTIGPFLARVWQVVVEGVKTAVNLFMTVWNALKDRIGPIIQGIRDIFVGLGTFLSGVFTLDMGKIADGLATIWNGFKTGISNIWAAVKDIFTGAYNHLKGFVKSFVPDSIQKAWGPFVAFFEGVGRGIKAVFDGVWDAIKWIVAKIEWAARKGIEVGQAFGIIGTHNIGDIVASTQAQIDAAVAARAAPSTSATQAPPDPAASAALTALLSRFPSALGGGGGKPIALDVTFNGLPSGVSVQAKPAVKSGAAKVTANTGKRQVGTP